MPAMHDLVYEHMLAQLERKKALMLRLLPFSMTHDECIRMVAPAEHVNILKMAGEVATIRASQSWMSVDVPAEIDGHGGAPVWFYMHTFEQREPPLMPRTPYWQKPTDAAMVAAGDRVIDWLRKRYEIGRKFGLARHVLYQLKEKCSTGYELRAMLPPVMHLCGHAEADSRVEKWATKHAEFKALRSMPALSPQLKRAVRDTAALLTSCALIGEDIPEPPVGAVAISVFSMEAFQFEGTRVSRL